jgi:hypothetical protein
MLLSPILPAFASAAGYLPAWLGWFQTYDNPLDGDTGFKTIHALYLGEQSGWKRYVNRVWWLLRNPGYTFDQQILGAPITSLDDMTINGDLRIADQYPAKAGYNTITIGKAWGLLYIKQISANYCLRIRLGWKLTVYADGKGTVPSNAQFVFSPRVVLFHWAQ